MVSEDKLIRQGIRYTDSLFKEISKRLTHDIAEYDTLEEYLEAHSDYVVSNPLQTTGYDAVMTRLILQSTNNIKYNRQAQRKLTQVVIEDTVGKLISNVGEDIKTSVREIVATGFNEKKAPTDIAKDIDAKIESINTSSDGSLPSPSSPQARKPDSGLIILNP